MTTPEERTWAVLETQKFLLALERRSQTPGVPDEIRSRATWLLRHYPGASDMRLAGLALPIWFGMPEGAKVPYPKGVQIPCDKCAKRHTRTRIVLVTISILGSLGVLALFVALTRC